jgi:TetR/AcrR family transcriptional repressor of nem operon
MMKSGTSKSELTRRKILDSGYKLLLQRGFSGVGIKDILDDAGVPKGSFYYYFESKEEYGCALLQDYVQNYLLRMSAILDADEQTAKARLMAYWRAWISDPSNGCSAFEQCLVVKLSAEVADLSEPMREILSSGVEQICSKLAGSIEQAIADGSLPALRQPLRMAQTLYQMWLGAALVDKIHSNKVALQQAIHTTEYLLAMPELN